MSYLNNAGRDEDALDTGLVMLWNHEQVLRNKRQNYAYMCVGHQS
jgi:hypothetical protein